MEQNSFMDKSVRPNDKRLAETLGKSYQYWEEIKNHLKKEYGETTEEWKFYGAKYGWGLKTLLKKRNLFFFAVRGKHFAVSFIFGEKAVSAVKQSDLPKNLMEELLNAKKYAEGRGLRLEVKSRKQVEQIKKLIEIKIAH